MSDATTLAPSPRPMPISYCKECGKPFYRTRPDREFCCDTHRNKFNQRRILGGLKLYDAAIKWRIERPKGAISELQFIVDNLAFDERERRRKRNEVIEAHRASLKATQGLR